MIIKCRKGTKKNILYFSTTFTYGEIINLQDSSYDIKCHFKVLPQPNGILTDYTLHDLQLKETVEKDLYLKISFRHKENPEQILVFSISLSPEGNYKSFYIILDCSNSNIYAPKFRTTACANVKEILQFILNSQKGIHCETCIYKYQKRLSDKCGEIYKFNKW